MVLIKSDRRVSAPTRRAFSGALKKKLGLAIASGREEGGRVAGSATLPRVGSASGDLDNEGLQDLLITPRAAPLGPSSRAR
jgi:hypothetical protein